MKKHLFFALFFLLSIGTFAQAPHIYEHIYPIVTQEDPEILALMDAVSADSIEASIAHLSAYHTRRCDSRYIYEVQDWLVGRYQSLGLDTVLLHDFKIEKPGFPEETADNVLGIQWGTKTPEEFVICGAHYDSWNGDGADPDTIRSPGADDNASGVAGIWETARLLSQHKFDRTIIYANWNAEELGLIGSAVYAKECAEQRMDIVGYLNMDMNGYLSEGSVIHIHLVYVDQDSLFANLFYDVCHTYYPDMPVQQNWMPYGDSDFSSFNRNGYPALHPFEDVYASSPYIHTRQDVLGVSVNNLEQSRRFAQVNLGVVAHLAGLSHADVVEQDFVNISLYPNPATDAVQIVSDEGLQQISICNLMGQQIKTLSLNGENRCTVSTSGFASGVYLLRISTIKGISNQRLVIK